ncbi:LANO_0C08724g1_1 [Lachancea nothofagi CBS 11611]|uniref:Glutamyl-tRNA(Gln) amidotransferase subunit A, mitochondrial n=1 Tax=Lachancea nothofagi CBS 11611 TaxID=1266666 RepID=A0A1G4J9I4_9SACH|nr:LANO_0C08724g1_1 [Lachancea nothofagi CBS 11611]
MSSKTAIGRLKRIPAVQKQFNVFTSINSDAEESLKNNSEKAVKPLGNLLCGIKDNIVTRRLPTSCGSKLLENYISPFDSTVVQLLEYAGAVNVGKTNLDEFGMGSGGTNSCFGATTNPLFPDESIVVGGSSSGSAAAVAADVVDFSIGTDTGGSVRLPAAYASVLGFKPSYGRISRHGVVAYAQSLDTVGIMAKSVNTLEKVFKVLDMPDEKDPTCLNKALRSKLSAITKAKSKLRIGIPKEFTPMGVSQDLRAEYLAVIQRLEARGHEIYPVSIPNIKNALPVYYTLAPAEAVSNLSRYDGLRYGNRDREKDSSDNTLFAPSRAAFGQEVKNRIVLGNYNLSSESFNNHYIKAQKLRVELINEFDDIFALPNILTGSQGIENGIDILLSLSAISTPITTSEYDSENTDNPITSYINDIFTTPASLAGLPAISVPGGNLKAVGVQIMGQFGDDLTVLNAAREIL